VHRIGRGAEARVVGDGDEGFEAARVDFDD
jgi:hypothetical protein